MSTDQDAAARRIMDQFGEESRIPTSTSRKATLASSSPSRSSACSLPASPASNPRPPVRRAGGSGFGVAIVYVSPDHLNAWTWTKDVYRYVKRPQITFSSPEEANSSTNETERNEGGLANYAVQARRTNAGPHEHRTGVAGGWRDPARRRDDGGVHRDRPGQHGLRDVRRLGPAPGRRRGVRQQGTRLEAQTPRDNPLISGGADYREHRRPPERRGRQKKTRSSKNSSRSIERRGRKRCATVESSRCDTTSAFKSPPLEVYDRFRDEGRPAEKLTQFPSLGSSSTRS